MMLTESGFKLVEQLQQQADTPSLLASFHHIVQSFGLSNFCIGDPGCSGARGARRWGGIWPADWDRHYDEQGYLRSDPVRTRVNSGAAPFRWSRAYERADARGRRVLDEGAEFGLREGLAMAIGGPGRALTGISVGGDTYELSRRDEVALYMASLCLHARLVEFRANNKARSPRLTPRECDCLSWVAAGKTDWEISQILNISEQTVHGYVQNALRKLNARTRAQAVALAMQSRQILR